jgi:tetratricopeptide (TPR) repeat protein
MEDEDYQSKLSEMRRDELNIIARKLNVKNYSQGTKQALIESIRQKKPRQIKKAISDFLKNTQPISDSFWSRHYNHIYGAVGIISLLLSIYFGLRSSEPNPFFLLQLLQRNQEVQEVSGTVAQLTLKPSAPTPHPVTPTQERAMPTPTPKLTISPMPAASSSARGRFQKPEPASVYINQARALFAKRKYPDALATINKAISIAPDNTEALNFRKLVVEHMNLVPQ